jgi:hypothetical protein
MIANQEVQQRSVPVATAVGLRDKVDGICVVK